MRRLSELRGMTTCPFCSAHRNTTFAGDAPRASAIAVTVSCVSTGFSRCPRIIHWLPSVLYSSYCHPSAVQNTRTSASALNTSELRCTTAGADGFPAGSLATLDPIPPLVLCERLIGIPLYMLLNVLPFALPLLLLSGLFKLALLYYILPLFLLGLGFWAIFYSKGLATGEGKGPRAQQYIYTERNSTRYVSLKMVWPASLHFPAHEGKQLIFCAIPHGTRRDR